MGVIEHFGLNIIDGHKYDLSSIDSHYDLVPDGDEKTDSPDGFYVIVKKHPVFDKYRITEIYKNKTLKPAYAVIGNNPDSVTETMKTLGFDPNEEHEAYIGRQLRK